MVERLAPNDWHDRAIQLPMHEWNGSVQQRPELLLVQPGEDCFIRGSLLIHNLSLTRATTRAVQSAVIVVTGRLHGSRTGTTARISPSPAKTTPSLRNTGRPTSMQKKALWRTCSSSILGTCTCSVDSDD